MTDPDPDPDPDPDLPPVAAAPLAAELLVQHAADRAAAPDPEDVVRRMKANGSLPDLDVQWPE